VKKLKVLVAVIALAALVCLAPLASSSSRPVFGEESTARTREKRWRGVCNDCAWRGNVYDRWAPAEEECLNHSDELGHFTCVVAVK
jgi:hypothetical protein